MNENYAERIAIKSWAIEDRPREKLILHGRRTLTEAELLAILIGSGSPSESAVELCKRILSNVNFSLHDLAKLDLADLCKFKGIGEAKAIAIIAALELGRRRKEKELVNRPVITSSKDVHAILKAWFVDLVHEEFWLILLNTANRVIGKILISKGGRDLVAVDPKIVFSEALKANATTIILAHNHPSGNLKPSTADEILTKRLIQGAKLLEIRILDHIIFSDEGYFSFLDEDLM